MLEALLKHLVIVNENVTVNENVDEVKKENDFLEFTEIKKNTVVQKNSNFKNQTVIPDLEEFGKYALSKQSDFDLPIDKKKVKLKYDAWLENGWKDCSNCTINHNIDTFNIIIDAVSHEIK